MMDAKVLLASEDEGFSPVGNMATVDEITADGLRIKLDGESTAGAKSYKRLSSYSNPARGDRVFLLRDSGTFIVLGKVVS